MNARFFVKTPTRIVILVLALSALAFVVVIGTFGVIWESWRKPTRDLWASVIIGDSEQSVLERLGNPYRAFDANTAPPDYYVRGYRRRERPITNRVLIYLGRDLILYVWIDQTGRIEEKFVGSS